MKSVSKRIMLLALFFFMAAFAAQADACTVVMAGKKPLLTAKCSSPTPATDGTTTVW